MQPVVLRPLRALSLALALGLSISCEVTDRCGDGVLDEDERCDDGNVIGGDGCSASCEPDDNLTIPGDERAGFFICAAYPPETSRVTCGPGSVCCLTDGPRCVSAEQGCVDVYNVVSCDGPEDCARAGDHCETLSHGTSCTTSEGSFTWCHRDADCVDIEPWLPNGACTSSGACDFTAGAVP
jgi:cysteine-rich repeat protein